MNNCKIHYDVQKAISNSRRIVIIHRHIFKNAGTTFDSILKNNFGDAFCDHRDDVPMRKEGEPYLKKYLGEHPDIKALSSHHLWFNPASDDRIQFVPVIFLRHPIERIRSVYNFERQQQSETPGAVMAKEMDFKAYVNWRMQDEVSPVIRNMHTRFLAGVKGTEPLQEKHFSTALKNMQQNPFVGVVDLFDKSLAIFNNELKKLKLGLDFSYTPQNVMQANGKTDCETRASEILDEIGEFADIVLEKNSYDLMLYRMAKQKIESE